MKDYHINSKSNDGYKSRCKVCIKEDNYQRYMLKKEHIKIKNKEYVLNNRDKVNANAREYYKNNRKKMNEKSRRWQSKNKKRLRDYNREYKQQRKKKDLIYRLSCKFRSQIHKVLKKEKTSFEYLGCNYEKLLEWLNDNDYGFIYGTKGLDIDHIIPLNSANNEEELIPLLHYTNLQLLPSYYNRHIKKDNEFNKKDFEQWLKKEI